MEYILPNGVISSYIYKYYPVTDILFDTIKNAQLWFSNPLDFNDPYDCNLRFSLDFDEKKIRTFLEEDLKGESAQFLARAIGHYLQHPDQIREIEYEVIRREIENTGISCFSASENILLMWSHYAGRHTGVCLKFDIEKDIIAFKAPYLVEYPEHLPRYDYFGKSLKRPHSGIMQHLYAIKSRDWAYEKEIRIIKWARDGPFRGLIDFDRDALEEVIFGYKVSLETQTKVRRLLAENGYGHVRLAQVRLKEDDFGLNKYWL
jgi:hypothetical protein